jgi:hypothetical protein
VQTNVLIKEEITSILKNKNKSYPYKKLSVFYNSRLKTFGAHLVCWLLHCYDLPQLRGIFALILWYPLYPSFWRLHGDEREVTWSGTVTYVPYEPADCVFCHDEAGYFRRNVCNYLPVQKSNFYPSVLL